MLSKRFKDYVQSIHPYQPGKPIKEVERELGLRHVIKLASNENPLGPSEKALRAMRKAIYDIHLYPDGSSYYLINKLAQELSVEKNQLLVTNGSNEAIELLMRGLVREGDEVISSESSFLVYPIITQACGGKFVSVPMTRDYRYDLSAIVSAITEKTRVIFIANPNNPTGTYVSSAEIDEFLSKVPQDVLVVFDEAYVDFVDAVDFPHSLVHVKSGKPNVLILRTFSKSYGLAGLRIGYCVGSAELISYFHKVRQPFNVNVLAQVAATAALEDKFFLWRTKRLIQTGKQYYYRFFKKLRLNYLPSQGNFVLVDTKLDGEKVCEFLLKKGIIVRSMKAYGLPTWIRVTIGRRTQNVLLCRHLKACLRKGMSL